jgi:prepilin-type N-terminal cleavage/methylation domain-containing protein
MNKRTTQSGFTLVEIAMVLIVIALLMGGILKAHEMIVNTRLKKIQSAEAGLLAAKNLYYDRYRQFPGDDPDASRHFTVYNTMPEVDGNGDGDIGNGDDWDLDEATPIVVSEQETLKFFAHLRAAGYIEGHATDFRHPHHNVDYGVIGIQNGAVGMMNHVVVFGNISGDYIRILDNWYDDGDQSTGPLRAAAVGDGMTYSDAPTNTIINEDRYNLIWKLTGF